MFDRRNLRSLGYATIGLLGGCAIAASATLNLGYPPHAFSGMARLIMVILSALAIAWAFFFAILSFRKSDEFTQQGSRLAWYWGGAIGLAASIPVFAFIALGGLSQFSWPAISADNGAFGVRALGQMFWLGYMLPVTMQLGGFLIVRFWWLVSRR